MKKTMNDYIVGSRKVVLDNLERSEDLVAPLVDLYFQKEYPTLTIVASGSSYNASVCVRPFLRKYLGKEVKVITPYTFEHYEMDEDGFIVLISQSGYSTNIISAAQKLKQAGKRVIGITSDTNSDLKNEVDTLIDYGCGIETVGYVTQGVVTLFEFLALFSMSVAKKEERIDQSDYDQLIEEMKEVEKAHEHVYESTQRFIKNNYKALTSMDYVYICGAGPNYGTALEGALKISETIQIPGIPLETEEFLHGPALQVRPKHTVFFIDNDDETSERIVNIFKATCSLTDRTFILTNQADVNEQKAIRSGMKVNPLLSPLCNLAAFELIAYQVTEDLHGWHRYPLYHEFNEKVAMKTENYVDREAE